MASVPPPPPLGPEFASAQPRKRGLPWWVWLLIVGVVCLGPGMVLAAILLPVLAQARIAAQFTQTVVTVKQVGTATIIYAADYDDRFPHQNWQDQLTPLVQDPDVFNDPFRVRAGGKNGLAFHDRLLGASMLSILEPEASAMIYLTTKEGPNAVGNVSDVRFPQDQGTVIGFADGSTRRVLQQEFDASVFEFTLQRDLTPSP